MTFTESQINNIYKEHVYKDDSYFKKFEKLPFEYNNKNWKWEDKDFPRIWCILDFQDWLKKHNIGHFNKVLSTCNTDPELEYIKYNEIYYAEYHQGFNDLHTLDLDIKDFDLIIFNQTLEHLYNPFLSVSNLYKHLKKDGYLFTSVPTINIPHMTPFHFNGLTPMGLCMLMKSAGFEIIEVGFWGNTDYIKYIFETGNWPDYKQLIKDGIIKNEREKNAQCWILVKK
jgi:SAM-dependent methyltransferase